MASMNVLRSRVESSLAGRIAAPFAYRDRRVADTVSCGISEIDLLAGGLPRGGLTEICGPPCSGRTSLLLAALAARTMQGESCALVDGRDGFDPGTAEAAGVRLERLLWVRCREIEQALRATDLLLRAPAGPGRGGGFGMIAVDLADIDPRTVRSVPLNAWFRFRRAVEDTPSILLLVEQESNAKTCASLVLRLQGETTQWLPECRPPGWAGTSSEQRYANHDSVEAAQWMTAGAEKPQGPAGAGALSHSSLDTWTQLLGGYGVQAEMAHARVQSVREISFPGAPARRSEPGIFQTRTQWSVA
jgi:hypothetical protein